MGYVIQATSGGTDSIGITIDGNGGVIGTGSYGNILVPYACTITGWYLFEISSTPVSSSIVIDTWKDTYANYPPTVADTIWGTKPSLTAATKNSATGLSIAITANDILKFNVDSVTSASTIQLVFLITKT